MKLTRAFLRSAGGGFTALAAAVAITASASPSLAVEDPDTRTTSGTVIHEYPETPALNPTLPIVKTTHKSDHIKANVINARPVCNALEDKRTTVYKVTDKFMPVGTISTTNTTDKEIPVTQSTSMSQAISLSVNGSRNENLNVNGNASGGIPGASGNFGIAYSLAKLIAGSASYNLNWSVGQTIGPYAVPSGKTGDATYGFRTITMVGTQQHCKTDGTWSNPTAWTSFAPVKKEVRVKIYGNAADSDQSGKPVTKEKPNPKPTLVTTNSKASAGAGKGTAKPKVQQKLDLEPHLSASDTKVSGYAGVVALSVKNVGTEWYHSDDPAPSFRVDVKTEEGPKGVDRLITPAWFNGAYTQDLGFNKKTSTRSFLVTLSNPVKKGEKQLVANFKFGDGKTSEGRLKNSISVTQIKRAKGDTSRYNDQNVSSKDITVNDSGKPSKTKGIF